MIKHVPLFALSAAVALSLSAYAGEGHDHADHDHGAQAPAKDHTDQGHAGHDHHGHDHAPGEAAHDHHSDHAHADHGHEHATVIAGPNGGRVLTRVEPHLEFLVRDDGLVQLSALNDAGEIIPITDQHVKVFAGDRTNPTRLVFAKQGDTLLSDASIPEGNNIPVVVRIQSGETGDRVTEKFNLNLGDCSGCSNKEYACTCEHAH